MDSRHIALVQRSYEKLEALGERLPELFYAELFNIDPSMRAMFDGDMRRQHMKLLVTLALIVKSLNEPEKLRYSIEGLAIKHIGYGVKAEHYTPYGNALLRTLKKLLGPMYTRDVADAWEAAFRMLARIMKQAAYEVAASERAAPRGARLTG